MSDRVQIFWDPYLKAFIIEVPTRNRSPSATRPKVVTPGDFQAPPTRTASFSMNPNAPLGSFYNPIPHPSEPTAMAASPMSMQVPTQAAPPPAQLLWPQDPTAPLGSFQNPVPYESYMPAGSAASPPPAVTSPASVSVPGPTAQPQDSQPTTAETDIPCSAPPLNTSPNNGITQHLAPNAAPALSPDRGTPLSLDINAISDSLQPTTPEERSSYRQTPTPSNSGRRVHFHDAEARKRASRDAEARAAARAWENEAEVHEFTDVESANRQRSTGWRPRTSVPSTPCSSLKQSSSRPLQADSRNSSSGSFVDPGQDWEYERWPLCTVCEQRPTTIKKGSVRFCDACFGQACAAEEARKRGGRRK